MQKDKLNKSESAQAITDFISIKKSNGLTPKTLNHYEASLRVFEEWRTKPLEELKQLDMAQYVQKLRETPLRPKSVELRMHPVKSFLRWMLTGQIKGTAPQCCIGLEIKKETRQKPHTLVNTKLLQYILGEVNRFDQKVYFTLLYDTGARRSEILDLRMGDIGRDEHGMYVELNGKTGYRKNYLHESIGLVSHYVNSLPDDPKWHLFNKVRENTGNERLSYGTVDKWMYRIREKLVAKKILSASDRLSFHSFRHTKARNLKRLKWSNDEINVWMGWAKNSNMSTYYGQAREEDVVNRFLEDTGRAKKDEEPTSCECPVCLETNGVTHKFCGSCGNALRPEFAHDRNKLENSQKLQAELKQARELIQQLKEIPHLSGHLGLEALE